MATELRKTGISVVGDVPWGTHFCYFYETKQDLLDSLVPYFQAGLESKEFCLWIISNSELITSEEAKEALGQAVADLDRHLAEGRIEIVSHDQWFLKGGIFDRDRVTKEFKEKLDEALARGYAGMRVNGSPAWIQSKDERELREFEEQLDHLFPNERIIASCTYPLEGSRAAFLLDVARHHQFAIARRQGQWEVLETPELQHAKQEIQALNQQLEQRVLDRTSELAAANEDLRGEIAERRIAEEELKKEKEVLEKIFDNIPVMIGFVGEDGLVKLVNPEWERTMGWTLKELQEQNVDIFAEAYPDLPYRQEVLDFVAAAKGEWVDLKIRVRDGRVINAACAVIHLSDGTRVAIAQDITERARAEERIKATSEQLRALSASLQSAREQESTRIARELHDELGGALTALRWDLEEVAGVISEAPDSTQLSALRKKIEVMTTLTGTTLDTIRRLASELRPMALDELGLVEAIEWQALQFQTRTGIAVEYQCSLEKVDLNSEQSTAVFRILQEALTNILRHAQATKVTVTMKQEAGEFLLTIKDNGRGITDSESSGDSLGLLGMRERAHLINANIEIIGIQGKETVVAVRIPVSEPDESPNQM